MLKSTATKRTLGKLSIAGGAIIGSIGLFFVGAYVKTVVESLGQADKSLIFWHLIFLFIGLGLLGLAIVLVFAGVKFHKEKSPSTPICPPR